MRRRFKQVDVFGASPGRGNPVAVVLDGDGLTTEQMQRFSAWANVAETAFVLPPREPQADYRVRIFTPALELPFAGHPTLGTCHAWLELHGVTDRERFVQECGAGLIEIRRTEAGLAFASPPLIRSGPVDGELLGRVIDALGVARGEIVDAEWIDNGPGWLGVLLSSAERVLSLEPGFIDVDVGVVGPHPAGSPEVIEVRGFTPQRGVMVEDPATGSLHASLAEWLLPSGRLQAPYLAHQGTAIDRDARIAVSCSDERIWVAGATTTILDGEAAL